MKLVKRAMFHNKVNNYFLKQTKNKNSVFVKHFLMMRLHFQPEVC